MTGLLGHRDEHLRQIERSFPGHRHPRARQRDRDRRRRRPSRWAGCSRSSSLLLQQGQHDRQRRPVALDRHGAGGRAAEQGARRRHPARRQGPPGAARRRAGRSATSTPSRDNVITFGLGPAGTGKSWLAVAMAVQALQAKQVQRIILTRPAVEAGERLGFLPGDLMAKVDPYLRPLYDALYDMVDLGGRPDAARAPDRRGGAARVHARPHAEQQLHHPRRGAEHHARADEDVPHPHRLRVQGGRHRRHHPGRRARRAQRARRARADPGRHRRPRLRAPERQPTSCATGSWPTSSPPTSAPTPATASATRSERRRG